MYDFHRSQAGYKLTMKNLFRYSIFTFLRVPVQAIPVWDRQMVR